MESCFGLVRPHQHGIAVGQQKGLIALCTLLFTAKAGVKHPFKRQLYTTHMGAGGSVNSVKGPCVFVAQWIERPPRVRQAFHIALPSIKNSPSLFTYQKTYSAYSRKREIRQPIVKISYSNFAAVVHILLKEV